MKSHLPARLTSCLSCSPAICHKRGRICTFPPPLGNERKVFIRLDDRGGPGGAVSTEAGHEHTPGELWSAATPTSWSSKHRLPRILMDLAAWWINGGVHPPSKSPRRTSGAASELHLALSLFPERFVNQSSRLIARLAARHAARTSPFARVKPCYFAAEGRFNSKGSKGGDIKKSASGVAGCIRACIWFGWAWTRRRKDGVKEKLYIISCVRDRLFTIFMRTNCYIHLLHIANF